MKYLFLALFLSGCAPKGTVTIFLKEEDNRFYNMKGENCVESGYVVSKAEVSSGYLLRTTYYNCEVTKEHKLKDFEVKQWILPKNLP